MTIVHLIPRKTSSANFWESLRVGSFSKIDFILLSSIRYSTFKSVETPNSNHSTHVSNSLAKNTAESRFGNRADDF